MKSRRQEIRDLARKAEERARGQTPKPGTLPSIPAPEIFEIACLCGQLLRLRGGHAGKRCSCPACFRKFTVTFAEDRGRKVPVPLYLNDSVTTGDTFLADAGSDPHVPALPEVEEPPLPDQLPFACPGCRKKMLVRRAVYDKRVRCPDCSARLLLTVVWSPSTRSHVVQPVRLSDPPSGDTSTALEIPK
jgi:hypothetical protein